MGGRKGPGELSEDALPRVADSRSGLDELGVPEAEFRACRLLLADEAQQAVALLQGASVAGQVARVGRRSLAGQLVEGGPAQRRRTGHEEHVLGREHDRAQCAAQGRRAPGNAVHADPFPGAARGRADKHHLDRVALLRAGAGPPDARLHPRQLGAPAHKLAVGARAVGVAPGQQDDGLEQARLAGRVGTVDELGARPEGDVEGGVAAQIADRDPAQDRRLRGRPSGVEAGVRQEVVRTGITTWTYAVSPTGRNTPGDRGPLSSSAKRSAVRLPSTSLR